MNPYLSVSGLDDTTLAQLLGYSPRLFHEWAVGQRPMPPSAAAHIGAVLGVDAGDLLRGPRQPVAFDDIEPAVWFKLRTERMGSADRELVMLVRQLGTFYEELETVRAQSSSPWVLALGELRKDRNPEAPAAEQGKAAAQVFRRITDLQRGKTGIGGLLRRTVRNLGILVVESPIRDSKIEGCAFPVGEFQRPCIFANNHGTTWFRRNAVILHELAHVIFDLPSEGASLDPFESEGSSFHEKRAEAFAMETSIPREVLAHVSQAHGIDWQSDLTARALATLVANLDVEKKLVLRAAVEYGLFTAEQAAAAETLRITDHLKQLTPHALSTAEYLRRLEERGESAEAWTGGRRCTSIPPLKLRLPVAYIQAVVEAFSERIINRGRAARLLMISEELFSQRFSAAAEQ